MKFLKTKHYIYRVTGEGAGVLFQKVFDRKIDAQEEMCHHFSSFAGWKFAKGSKLSAMTAGNQMKWEVI